MDGQECFPLLTRVTFSTLMRGLSRNARTLCSFATVYLVFCNAVFNCCTSSVSGLRRCLAHHPLIFSTSDCCWLFVTDAQWKQAASDTARRGGLHVPNTLTTRFASRSVRGTSSSLMCPLLVNCHCFVVLDVELLVQSSLELPQLPVENSPAHVLTLSWSRLTNPSLGASQRA